MYTCTSILHAHVYVCMLSMCVHAHMCVLSMCMLICDSLIAQVVKNLPSMQETPVQFLGREDPLEKG